MMEKMNIVATRSLRLLIGFRFRRKFLTAHNRNIVSTPLRLTVDVSSTVVSPELVYVLVDLDLADF